MMIKACEAFETVLSACDVKMATSSPVTAATIDVKTLPAGAMMGLWSFRFACSAHFVFRAERTHLSFVGQRCQLCTGISTTQVPAVGITEAYQAAKHYEKEDEVKSHLKSTSGLPSSSSNYSYFSYYIYAWLHEMTCLPSCNV
jgi:hypothetical protein